MDNKKDVFGILNEFAVNHRMIKENGSYASAEEVLRQSDEAQNELIDLVSDLYDALEWGYKDRREAVVQALVNDELDITAGFNDYEFAHIMNEEG